MAIPMRKKAEKTDDHLAALIQARGAAATLESVARALLTERHRHGDEAYIRLTLAAQSLLRLAREVP